MKKLLIGLVIVAAICFGAYEWLLWSLSKPAAPLVPGSTVTLQQGQIQGGVDASNASVQQFNGIPFASPPVGDLRWRPPVKATGWDGVRDARAFGPQCMQLRNKDGAGGFYRDLIRGLGLGAIKTHLALEMTKRAPPANESEDCLSLNVRTANLGGETLQPVMVWFHGGSHHSGSGSLDLYQGNGLVENDVIVVTINYRLNLFGYFAHPALSADDPRGVSGNYGLLDQIAALEWVRENIAVFGGDPANVTIFGESAGAQAVSEVMATPLGDGLYHKAILQSGSSSYNANGLTTAIEGRMSMHEAGVKILSDIADETAKAADLRALPAADIVAQFAKYYDLNGYALPTVDGVVLPRLIGQAIRDGNINNVPVLAGYNADEATLFYDDIQSPTVLFDPFPEEHEARMAKLDEIYGPAGADILRAEYGLGVPSEYEKAATDMLGDDIFGIHMRLLGRSNAAAGEPTYLYHFTRTPASETQTIGAFHAGDINFVFGNLSPLLDLHEHDPILVEAIGKYWTNFAKSGDPNGDELPNWPLYSGDTDLWMTFNNASIEVKPNIRRAKLDVMEAVLDERISQAANLINPTPETMTQVESATVSSAE